MSTQGSFSELDVAHSNIKGAASNTETLSLSTIGLNSIKTEEEVRDEVQPDLDAALDGTREKVEGVVVAEEKEDEIREDVSLAPSLAQSLAPSLASIKTLTDSVAAAAIQCIAPAVDEPPRSSDQSVTVSRSKSVTAKEEVAGDFDDEKSQASSAWTWTKAAGATQDTDLQLSTSVSVPRSRSGSSKNSKRSSASKASKSSLKKESEPVVAEAPVQSMVVPVAGSGSSVKSTKSNKSTRSNKSTKSVMSPIEQPLMKDTSFSGQISKTSQQTTTSKTSIGGIEIEGHLVTIVPMRSPVAEDIEVNTKQLKKKQEVTKQKQKKKIKKLSFFTAKTGSETKKVILFPLTKKSKTKKKKSEESNDIRSTKKGGWLKKLSQRKKHSRDTSVPAADSISSQVVVDVVVPVQSVQVEQGVDSAGDAQVVTKASTVESEKVVKNASTEAEKQVVMNASTVSEKPTAATYGANGLNCCSPAEIWGNGWFKVPAKAQKEVGGAVSIKADVVAEASSAEEKTEEEKKEVNEHKILNASERDVTKGFVCSAPSAMWGKVNGWLRPMSAQESLYGSADVVVGKTEEVSEVQEVEKKESPKESPKEAQVSMCNIEEAQMVMCSIEEIKARWFGASEEPKPSLNKEMATDIGQAVFLLNAQRSLIKEKEEAIKAEEAIIQGAENVQDFQAAEKNKARLQRELTHAQQLEVAAKELVHHLFNSLTPEARLEAIRLSDDIAKADIEVSQDDEIDFGLCLDPYIHTVQEEYGDVFESDDNVNLRSNSNDDLAIKVSRFPSGVSKTLSSKSSIKASDYGQ